MSQASDAPGADGVLDALRADMRAANQRAENAMRVSLLALHALFAARDALQAENSALREMADQLSDVLGEDDDDFPDDAPITIKFGRTTHYSLKLGFLRRARTLVQGGADAG